MRYYSRLFASLVLLVVLFLPSVRAFAPIVTSRTSCSNNYRLSLSTGSNEDSNFVSTFFNTITQRYQLFQQSKSEGYDFKQSTAIAIAGTYDANDVQSKINDHVASAPCFKSLVLSSFLQKSKLDPPLRSFARNFKLVLGAGTALNESTISIALL